MIENGDRETARDGAHVVGPFPVRFVSEAVLQRLLDALGDQVALVEPDGRVVAVNAAWRRFADANGFVGASHGVGADYVAVCEAARGDAIAEAARDGIRAVLRGTTPEFTLRYPCPGAAGPAWYEVRAASLGRGLPAVVAHRVITELVETQNRLVEALRRIRSLTDRLASDAVQLHDDVRDRYEFEDLVGETAAMRRLTHRIAQVARTDATVLVLGETGTGKELVARAIHDQSARSHQPLIRVNCAALPSTLIESELFGHEKGAFTGAIARKIGRFELADGGTIFLDEIGDVDPAVQAKLLRVLQQGEFERVGSSVTLRVDVRVIAATNRDLRRAMTAGTFRHDLYYRLTVFPIEVPPLRDRSDDVPLLVWYFIAKHQDRLGKNIDRVPARTMEVLARYPWPGNVRELENVIERALIVTSDRTLRLDGVLELASGADVPGTSLRLDDSARAHIVRVLDACGGRLKGRGNAADRLGVKPSTLRSRMKRLGISRRRDGE